MYIYIYIYIYIEREREMVHYVSFFLFLSRSGACDLIYDEMRVVIFLNSFSYYEIEKRTQMMTTPHITHHTSHITHHTSHITHYISTYYGL